MLLKKRAPLLPHLLVWLLSLCLLLVWGQAAGHDIAESTVPPYEVTDKDLTSVYGRYEIYEADEYRGGFTTAAEAQAWVGQELIVTATLFRFQNLRIENPTYKVWFYPAPLPLIGWVPKPRRWSGFYYGYQGDATGDEVIKVYKSGGTVPDGPWVNLELIGPDELWMGSDGWYYKARKTDRPVLSAGHADYCQVMGPCSAGQGDCDGDSECQSGLACVDDVGASHGFAADVDVCEASTTGSLVVPTQVQSIYRRATTTPSAPSGGTAPRITCRVGGARVADPHSDRGGYRSQRTVTYQGGVSQLGDVRSWGLRAHV